MEKNKIFIIVVLFLLLVSQLFAQGNKKVNGQVTDDKGAPLKGVFVTGDEGDVYTTTDAEGKFSLEVLLSDVIMIEKDGFNSKQVSVKGLSKGIIVPLSKPDFLMTEKDMLEMPFRLVAKNRSTSNSVKIDVEELRNYDASMGLNAAINGRVPGLFGTKDMWGRGDAVIVVDGVPRTDNYDVNLLEVESITVLKDPISRSLYGAFGDKGVIMVKTKRGKAYKKVMNFQAETGFSRPIENTFPKYMNAADYLQTLRGLYPTDSAYSISKINDTRNGVNRPLNPDNDLYSNEFLKSQTEYQSFRAESSGGNKMAQYYLNVGWQGNNGWGKLADESTNKLNIRGNVDYQISDNFKMNLDAGALVNIIKSANIDDYWKIASTERPNAKPLYWDPALITNTLKRDSILKSAVLLPNGMLVGGNPTYPTNFYGDIFKKGKQVTYERNLQVNVGAEWDLKFLLPGLKAKGYLALDAYNTLIKEQKGEYASYNPTMIKSKLTGLDSVLTATTIGADKKVSNYAPVEADMYFHRRIAAYGSLAYDQSFDKTDVSLLAVAYRDQLALKDSKQEQRNLTFGLNGNVMHNKKYLLDFSLSLLGSQRLTPENRMTFAPSLGLGWILSEEDFLANNDVVNYLKLRTSAGIMKNDNWDNYWLHSSAFQGSGTFNYNNAGNSNTIRTFSALASDVNWQKRKELVLGFDASMFENALWLEGSVFYTQQYDMITELKNLTPLLAGTNTVKYWGNYNSDRIQGFDLGLKYNMKITNDLSLMVGSNIVVKSEKTLKQDEPNYTEDYQFRAGTATNSHWGLNSEGLYGVDDFDAVTGNLLPGLAIPSWGKVAPGDIKYVDTNEDGKINSTDVHIIGQQGANFQYSMYLNLKYKQFDLYAIAVGYVGGNSMRTGDYYRPYGNVIKYPEHLKTAYSIANQDVSALYPRLTTTKSDHNNQTSDYWMYNGNSFSIPNIQLTYNYIGKPKSVVKDLKIYLKGSNLIRYNANPTFANLSLNAPKTYSISLGTIFSF